MIYFIVLVKSYVEVFYCVPAVASRT